MGSRARKIFKIVGIVALGVATAGIGLAIAAGGIGAAAGATVGIFGASVSALTVGSIGAGLLAIGSMPKPPSQASTGANQRGQATYDPNALAAFVFGTTTVPSTLVFEQVTGTDKDTVSAVYAHAWHRIESYDSLSVSDESGPVTVTFSGDAATGTFANILTWHRDLGAPGQAALSLPSTAWTSTAVGAGVAHSAMIWNFKNQNVIQPVPTKFDITVKGAWLYDPRLDSTVGGSGTQRLDDPTTWSFNDGNAALVLLRYLIGEYSAGGELIWGRGAGYGDFDMETFISMANIADEALDGTVRFKLGGMYLLDGNLQNFVNQWQEETGGKLSKAGGIYRVWLPNNDLTPLTTITDDDLLAGQPIQHTIAGSISSLYNTARGQYIEPSQGYRGLPYAEVSEAAAITDDGGKRVLSQDFSWVQEASIAQRIARIKVRRTRFQRIYTIPMGWKGQGTDYKPFTVHELQIKETGNNPQLVRVIDRKMAFNGVTVLTLQQEDASIYDDTLPLGDPWASNTIPARIDRLGTTTPRYIDGTLIDALRPSEISATAGAPAGTPNQYSDGTDVNALRPGEAGADVTGDRLRGNLLPNWTLDIADSSGKPAGLRGVQGISDRSQIAFGGIGVVISFSPIGAPAYGFPAIPIDDRATYTVTIRHRTSTAAASGLFVTFEELAGPLPSGKTHIGYPPNGAESMVAARTREQLLAANAALPGTTTREDTYTYTPTSGTQFATFVATLSNPSAGTTYEIERVQVVRQGDHARGADVTSNNASTIIFRQPEPPSGDPVLATGWIWQDTDDRRIYRWSGVAWVQIGADDALALGLNAPAEGGANVTETRYSLADFGPEQSFSAFINGFTPTVGGTMYYRVSNDGKQAVVYLKGQSIQKNSGSDNFLQITNLPAAIQASFANSGYCVAINGLTSPLAQAQAGGGAIGFSISKVVGSVVTFDPNGWTTTENKGLPGDFSFQYSL